MSDFSRFAVLAMPIPETTIPADLITGLELACNQGPLGPHERRSIGTVPSTTLDGVLASLRKRLNPIRLDVRAVSQVRGTVAVSEVFVHRLAT